jgi:S-adenosylmethionine-diacylglycerol 3-amino-3-carboxypropyl transferase
LREIFPTSECSLVSFERAPGNSLNSSYSLNSIDSLDFSFIRYAQVWEDADVLLEALNIQPDDVCFSIASAGDNALALLAQGPEKVVAVDLNAAQLACLELRVAAYRLLRYEELLALIGTQTTEPEPANLRPQLYQRCRPELTPAAAAFWDSHPEVIRDGIGHAGKFERYFRLFRRFVVPLIHNRSLVDRLLAGGSKTDRGKFYEQRWNTWRWRLLFHLFFSRHFMGLLGRDPSFFRYVEGSVARRILTRTQHALTELNPAENPYLQWILKETHTTALPFALRRENFEKIRAHLDRLEWKQASIDEYLAAHPNIQFSKWNLSDVFEYLAEAEYESLLRKIVHASRASAGLPTGLSRFEEGSGQTRSRIVYWNMLAPRSCPASLSDQINPLNELAQTLFQQDKAFFYSRLVIEEVI